MVRFLLAQGANEMAVNAHGKLAVELAENRGFLTASMKSLFRKSFSHLQSQPKNALPDIDVYRSDSMQSGLDLNSPLISEGKKPRYYPLNYASTKKRILGKPIEPKLSSESIYGTLP